MITGALIALVVSGSPATLLPALGCVLMMVVMMAAMSGHGGGSGGR